jgi:hypothetical protein
VLLGCQVLLWEGEGEDGGAWLEPLQPWASLWLQACASLVVVQGSPWRAPLARVVCPAPAAPALTRGGRGELLQLRVHVYFHRLIFYLIAYEPLQTVMEQLDPSAPLVRDVHAATVGLSSTVALGSTDDAPRRVFSAARVAGADRFTLEGLLRMQEHTGCAGLEPAVQDSLQAQLSKTLKEYQRQTVAWMLRQERLPGGLNSLFWQTRQWAGGGGHHFYYAPALGELRLECPPLVRGGLLCDEMGLGKTLEVISLVVATLRDPLLPPPAGRADISVSSRASLIVVPDTLLVQWVEEVSGSTTPPGLLKVVRCIDKQQHAQASTDSSYTDVGALAANFSMSQMIRGSVEQRLAALDRLADSDIVLATYRTLEKHATAFKKIHWKRVVLDEMQEIRSSTTVLAKQCERLSASTRWMVSGTPLYDGIDDLNGELHFLNVWPFSLRDTEDGFWQNKIGLPWQRRDPAVLGRLQLLLGGVMMRHSKQQTTLVDGRSILHLPGLDTKIVAVTVTPSESAVIYFLEAISVKLLEGSNILASVDGQPDEGGEDGETNGGEGVTADEARLANRQRRRRAGGLIEQLLKLQRQACSSANLIAGGAGARHRLREVDTLLRRVTAIEQAVNGNNVGAAAAAAAAAAASGSAAADSAEARQRNEMVVRPVNRALEELLQGQQRQQLRQNSDFEWTSSDTVNMYHTGGWRQAATAVERRDEAVKREVQLQQRLFDERHYACWRRWRWAVELISSGRGVSIALLLGDQAGTNTSTPGHNIVSMFFQSLPLGILRKIVRRAQLARAHQAAQDALAAQQATVSLMSNSELAMRLRLGDASQEAVENMKSRATRLHYERQLLDTEREHVAETRAQQLALGPVGWRQRSSDRALDPFRRYPAEAKVAWVSSVKVAQDLQNLAPWLAVCTAAAEAELSGEASKMLMNRTSGFQDLQSLMDGSSSGLAQCPICMEPLVLYTEAAQKPAVVTRCLHLFCKGCIDAHMRSFRVVNHNLAKEAECQVSSFPPALYSRAYLCLLRRDSPLTLCPFCCASLTMRHFRHSVPYVVATSGDTS